MKRDDSIIGHTFNRWTITSPAGSDFRGQALVHATCNCGTERVVNARNVKSGKSKSCGCLKTEMHTRHGQRKRTATTPEYRAWQSAVHRFTNPRVACYKNYGGRGIKVCDRWRGSFETFLADMGRRPSPDLSLDRIDNDGNYEPGNFRWATREQQNANRRIGAS